MVINIGQLGTACSQYKFVRLYEACVHLCYVHECVRTNFRMHEFAHRAMSVYKLMHTCKNMQESVPSEKYWSEAT